MFAYIEIDTSLCKGCGLCTISCPRKHLYLFNENSEKNLYVAKFKEDARCWGCAFCASICPDMAIKIFSSLRNEITGRLTKQFSLYRKIVDTPCR
jgi:2-oxoglutarate ferredoxin oxidoreductase subunit delta